MCRFLERTNSSSCFLSLLLIQQALYRFIGAKSTVALYSFFRRNWITSNWSWPTVPITFLEPISKVKSWATPSSINCLRPFSNCLAFIVSLLITSLKISGEKLGMPLNWMFSPSVSVSPILRLPVSYNPTISPGKASSMISLSWAIKEVIFEKRKGLVPLTWLYGLFLSNLPEHILKKAMRFLWLGSILAWILKTKPLNLFSSGLTSRSSVFLLFGGGAMLIKVSSISCTPKLLTAEPKNTGATLPSR